MRVYTYIPVRVCVRVCANVCISVGIVCVNVCAHAWLYWIIVYNYSKPCLSLDKITACNYAPTYRRTPCVRVCERMYVYMHGYIGLLYTIIVNHVYP